jgi:bifunctional DNA-binding transcriptional regulator/antitoxin component of YhaV-PrlF toxin-antitoxin module
MASSMWTLTISSRGRITLPKDLLMHLGVGPGDEIDFELLADGPAALMRGKPSKTTANDPGLNTVSSRPEQERSFP